MKFYLTNLSLCRLLGKFKLHHHFKLKFVNWKLSNKYFGIGVQNLFWIQTQPYGGFISENSLTSILQFKGDHYVSQAMVSIIANPSSPGFVG
jgi:hypothetical protein